MPAVRIIVVTVVCRTDLQAGFILRQGHVPAKCRANRKGANRAQNSHLKQRNFLGLGDYNLTLYTV